MYTFTGNGKPLLLVFPHNVMAHYLRCLQLAKYMQTYFSIKFLYSSRYHSFIKQAGFESFECITLDAEKVQQCVNVFDFSWLNEQDLNAIYRQQVKVIKETNASAVLGDMDPTLKMAAEKTGAFYFSLINGYMSRHYAYVRRMPRSYRLYKLFNLLPQPLFDYFTNIGEHIYFHDIHRAFNKIRKREGLPSKYSYMQELEGDVNLLCDLPELFPQKNLPTNYYFIPPLFHKPKNKSNEIAAKLDSSQKTLYVSMGSTGDWKKVAFLNHPDYSCYNIITAGDTHKIIHGSNVFSYSFVDDDKLFNVIDLVICHGGNGTTYQALSYGIPVLCKTSHLEQDYNVDGLERMKISKSLNNITSHEKTLSTIQEWIHRKNSAELLSIKNKIADKTNRFQQIIDEVLTGTFFHENNPATP